MEFTPLTTVEEIVSQLNEEIGMPDSSETGFALMSDWPGVEERACFYLFPSSKLCDFISKWMDSLDELNPVKSTRGQRSINLTYANRLRYARISLATPKSMKTFHFVANGLRYREKSIDAC